MKKNWKIILPALLLLLFLLVVVFKVDMLPAGGKAATAQSELAPDFTLKDLQGREFKLSEQRGKPVLLVFGATWCPSCREEIPYLKEIYAKYARKGLVVVNIDIEEYPDQVARFAEKYQLPYRVLLDETGQVARNYRVRGIPNFTLLNKEGRIVCRECPDVEPLLNKLLTK